ncbi:Panacea domain-containing protein [Sphingomonas radiodurans]|uniref:Panacea domain-containing protein n=1 Tax=Sphingomonas radiodurans TaxID=2890321 RepID=UPI001E6412C0|nr:type II toxin-antitoxin system antitoxin SocA domain-containing protein [Sphingomonas radiodurans]WBH15012.1 DUF4065 domain-containing protein [Sphingomonas radiodurans]
MPATTAIAAANQFLKFAQAEPQFAFDQMKLQKLLFYTHAWHLAYDRGPLFENDFEAWPWGPVIRDVYMQTKDAGRNRVCNYLTEVRWDRPGGPISGAPDGVDDPETREFLKSVWDTMKAYTGIQLSNSTHAPGEPWTLVAQALGTSGKPMISNTLIRDVFKAKLGAQPANPTA